MSNFGSGSNSNGNFWYGSSTNFPGFLYKKNVGVGGRRSTKMNPGGNTTCNGSTYLYNKYKPGSSGVGASSISNRRAKNRLATVCAKNSCFPCYSTLGQYSHNPNGFVECLIINQCAELVSGNSPANMDTTGMETLFNNYDTSYTKYLSFTDMDFYFFGTNYGDNKGVIYMTIDYAFGFGPSSGLQQSNWPVGRQAILFDFFDTYNMYSHVSQVQSGTIPGVKYLRIVCHGTDQTSHNSGDTNVRKAYEIYYVRDNCYQYMQFKCNTETVPNMSTLTTTTSTYANGSNITDGTSFQNTFGTGFSSTGPQTGVVTLLEATYVATIGNFFKIAI